MCTLFKQSKLLAQPVQILLQYHFTLFINAALHHTRVAFEIYIYAWDTLRTGLYLSVDIMLLVWTCCSRNGQGHIYI